MSLSGPQQKFAEGVAMGLNLTDAYVAAYPRAERHSATPLASRLRRQPGVQAEIARIRKAAEADLWNAIKHMKYGTEYKLPNKLSAIILDNDLAGDGSDANAADALAELLGRVRR
jgi:phage terminase small subunit